MVGTALMISLSQGHVSARHTEAQRTKDIKDHERRLQGELCPSEQSEGHAGVP